MRMVALFAAASLALSCSGAAPPPPAEGLAQVQVGGGGPPSETDDASCDLPFSIPPSGANYAVDYPMRDGAVVAGATARVACSIVSQGDMFAVDARLAIDETTALSITGTMSQSSSDVRATFSYHGLTFEADRACLVSFGSNGQMGVFPGRMWGIIACPKVRDTSGLACTASAEFLFQECRGGS